MPEYVFLTLLFTVAVLAGAVASISGFGIGSILTPLMALQSGIKIAVAAISIPHVIGSALRLWILKGHVNKKLLVSFGIASAVFGLLGAVLHSFASGKALSVVFGALLVLTGVSSLAGIYERFRPNRATAWIAGGLSGILGGLVGNQGGIRTAALLGFNIPRDALVATATAIALAVDLGRVPVYLVVNGTDLFEWRMYIAVALARVAVGTLFGARLLVRIPQRVFEWVVALLVIVLGVYMIVK